MKTKSLDMEVFSKKGFQKNFGKFAETELLPFPFLNRVAYWDTENVTPR